MKKITQNTYINVRTREEYNALMDELDKQDSKWADGKNFYTPLKNVPIIPYDEWVKGERV